MTEINFPKAEDLVGQTVAGRFEVKRLLGQGGMGAVYEALQQPLGRRVALKVIKRSLTDDAIAVKRFTVEARSVAQLSHPHIVTVHDFGQAEDGKLFIAMEFLDGESVRERLQRQGAMPWQQTLPIIVEVCQALVDAHAQNIIHRDLKPDNVMLVRAKGRDDYVKVVDFGVAKLLEVDDSASRITSTGMAVGTPGYISPEQIDGITDDPRSDLYSLGVTWFEMLTNHSPFSAATPVKLVLEHMTKPAPRPSELAPNAGISPEVDQLVQRLMGKAPEGRATTADALLDELEALWSRTPALPPDAATAALETGEVNAVRAAAQAPAATPPATPHAAGPATPVPATPPGAVAPATPPGAIAPATPASVTPATGGVAAAGVVPSAGVVAPAPPQKRSAAQWLGIGCLLFVIAPVSTCAMCVAVADADGPNVTVDEDDLSGMTLDLRSLTSHGEGVTVSSKDGETHIQLPSLGSSGADRLLESLVQSALDDEADGDPLGRLQALEEAASEADKEAYKMASKVVEKIGEVDGDAPAALPVAIDEDSPAPTADAGLADGVGPQASDAAETKRETKAEKRKRLVRERRAARAAKKAKAKARAKTGQEKRDALAEELTADETVQPKPKPKKVKRAKAKRPARVLDNLFEKRGSKR